VKNGQGIMRSCPLSTIVDEKQLDKDAAWVFSIKFKEDDEDIYWKS
jgi:hypothetical protein